MQVLVSAVTDLSRHFRTNLDVTVPSGSTSRFSDRQSGYRGMFDFNHSSSSPPVASAAALVTITVFPSDLKIPGRMKPAIASHDRAVCPSQNNEGR